MEKETKREYTKIASSLWLFWAAVIGWLAGCFVATRGIDGGSTVRSALLIGEGGAALVAYILFKHPLARGVTLGLAVFLGGVLTAPKILTLRSPLLPYNQKVTLEGIVTKAPPSFTKTHAIVLTTRAFGPSTALEIALPQTTTVKVGERVLAEGELTPLSPTKTESSRRRSARTRVWGQFARGSAVTALGMEPQNTPLSVLRGVRRWATEHVARLPEPYGGLLAGLLWGEQEAIDPELYKGFANAGLAHIVALSGYNIAIFIRALRWLILLVGMFGYAGIASLVIGAFVLFAGASATIVRAALFGIILILGEILGRPARALPALGVVAVAMTAVNPALVVDLSFQLSFLATFGLLVLGPVIAFPLTKRKIPRLITEPLSATLAATALTLPRIAGAFGRVSLVSPLTNLAVLPIVPAAMGLGALALLLGTLPGIGRAFEIAALLPLWWIVKVTEFANRIPYATLHSRIPEMLWWILLGGLLLVLTLRIQRDGNR